MISAGCAREVSVNFKVDIFDVRQLAKQGLWLVTAECAFDIAMLFLRVQEFYESANEAFVGRAFTILDYMRWYSLNLSDEKSFTYPNDFEGFNLPRGAIDACAAAGIPDPNPYDLTMARITAGVLARQGGDYYLIGARKGDDANIAHEVAHGMFYLVPDYRARSTLLVDELAQEHRDELFGVLRKQGYSDRVQTDEAQAYLATGLFQDILHLEHLRHPFMRLFATYRKKLIGPKRARVKKVVTPAVPIPAVAPATLLEVKAA